MNIVQFYKNKAFKISLIVIINLWSLLFILDYLATRKKSNFIYNGVITKAYNVKRSSSILHFIKLENNTMPIDLADALEIKIGENITSSIGFFTNIVFSISYFDNM